MLGKLATRRTCLAPSSPLKKGTGTSRHYQKSEVLSHKLGASPLFQRAASGFSLLELVAATALIGVTLVSALELMRDGMDMSTETDQRLLLASYGASQLEQRMATVADAWTTGTFTGDYTDDGWASIRYTTTCSDSAVDGGITNFLMDIQTTIFYDADGDDSLDSNELSCVYHTKIGKFTTYEELTP